MYLDEIRLNAQVGLLVQQGMTQVRYYLNTHIHFDIAYDGAVSHKDKPIVKSRVRPRCSHAWFLPDW